MSELEFSDWEKLDLRIAEILDAERVEGTKKLLKLKIGLGNEERQLVAGIAETYSPEEAVGKKIVVVANMKPKVIKGIESRGMLLAAVDKKPILLVPDMDVPVGCKVS